MKEETFTFHYETHLPVSKEEAFAWFEKPGAFERLLPPFVPIQIIEPIPSLKKGERVRFKYSLIGKSGFECIHEIIDFEKNNFFTDIQVKGPFTSWLHHRKFWGKDKDHTVIEEIVKYKLPLDNILGQFINTPIAKQLTRLFNYRQEVLKKDFLFLKNYPQKKLHVLMTGSTGLIGSALTALLQTMGHIVTPIRRHLSAGQEGIFWDIENQKIDPELLEDQDAVIHLAGENIAQYWTAQAKEKIYKSRIHSTRLLVNALNKLKNPPKTFISASGLHYYQPKTEFGDSKSKGEEFLHHVVKDWEEESSNLKKEIRVAHIRTGVVLSPKGGMLGKVLSLYKYGLGHKVGNGKMHLSWISIDDLVYLYTHVLMTPSLKGPINATSPYPVTQLEFSLMLAKLLKRPHFLKIPSLLIKTFGGQMAEEVLLSDLNILPEKLIEIGYSFKYPHLKGCLSHLLGIE